MDLSALPWPWLPRLGLRTTVALTVGVATVLVLLPFVPTPAHDVPLLGFMLATALCAARFGIAGGIASGALGVPISWVWYAYPPHDHGGGLEQFAWHAASFLVIGLLVGAAVSDRRQLERAIDRHTRLSLDMFCIATYEGYLTCMNPAWTRVLGYRLDELEARPFIDLVHPDDREATVEVMTRQTREGDLIASFENRYRHKDGSYRWLEWTSRPDAGAARLMAVARDVTQRKQAEAALAHYQERLERTLHERTAELDDARLETLQRLALAAEYRDDDTHRHTERVGRTAQLLAERLGVDPDAAAVIRRPRRCTTSGSSASRTGSC
jgi:PAS domain S-box-containing protein